MARTSSGPGILVLCTLLIASNFHGAICLGKDKLLDVDAKAPEGVEVTFPAEPCGDTAVISWSEPTKKHLLSSIVVKCETLTDRVVEIVDGVATRAEIGPLELGVEYECEVVAKGKFGLSPAANTTIFTA